MTSAHSSIPRLREPTWNFSCPVENTNAQDVDRIYFRKSSNRTKSGDHPPGPSLYAVESDKK
ncbi:hypothetical protein N7516_006453 [Penicillium verrucosum]|uniref:uncharacterized protein n=1 Tax=Penicillium verrucosum TaxID=60171 RepID=UPI0025451672|nr:uncharacterized protein N7516_006453 [Penicillium verrucosum]KAJ5931964.1 hypothetical protein N7516_006453 [Penicillium verrucosum]